MWDVTPCSMADLRTFQRCLQPLSNEIRLQLRLICTRLQCNILVDRHLHACRVWEPKISPTNRETKHLKFRSLFWNQVDPVIVFLRLSFISLYKIQSLCRVECQIITKVLIAAPCITSSNLHNHHSSLSLFYRQETDGKCHPVGVCS